MVFFVLTRMGFEQLTAEFGQPPFPLWINAGVLSQEELEELRAKEIDVTDFAYSIAVEDRAEIDDAVATIAGHYSKQTIWVEYVVGA